MTIDGKKIAEDIYTKTQERIKKLGRAPVLAVITCAPNFETKKYLALKEKKALSIGIVTRIVELDVTCSTHDFITAIKDIVPDADGIIVQFPLPPNIHGDQIVASIPYTHDVDGLNPGNIGMHTPVVDACREILSRSGVAVQKKCVTIIGSGRLVGLPMYHWCVEEGAYVSVVTRDTQGIFEYTKHADIIVCGAGVPGLLTPPMVKEGVVILDAGTSEDGGELRGDADPKCAEKASVFTPVPGGIGPITIAILLSNVVDCAERKKHVV